MQGGFSSSAIYQVQQANDIIEVISEYVRLTKKGREMVGICPFHEDHKPSMNVNPNKQIFKCFACGAGGDVFKFLQLFEKLTFPQAVERLAQRASIPLEVKVSSQTRNEDDIDPNKLAKANEWAAKHFQENLKSPEGAFAREYLAQRHIDLETAAKWQLGLALEGDKLTKQAKSQNANLDVLVKAGLLTSSKNDRFFKRLMFPIKDVTGRVIAFGGRTLDETGAKYINTNTTILYDKSNCVYGLDQAKHRIVETGQAIVVEGYTDCIMPHDKGITNVVATLGTSFTNGHGRILKRYAKTIVLLFDSDTAGMAAANRTIEICLAQKIDVKIAFVPQGKDPCDFVLSAGKEAFEKVVAEAVDIFKFKWTRLTDQISKTDNLADNKTAFEEFINTIVAGLSAGFVTAIEKGLIINKLAHIIGLSKNEINAEINKRLKKTKSYNTPNHQVKAVALSKGPLESAYRQIIEVLLNKPEFYDQAKQFLAMPASENSIMSQIAAVINLSLCEKPDADLNYILTKTESTDLAKNILDFALTGEQKGNFEKCFNDALAVIEDFTKDALPQKSEQISDENEYLKKILETSVNQNRHNIGMI